MIWSLAGVNNRAQAQPLPERRPISGRVIGSDNTPVKGATITIRQQVPEIALATFWGARVATDSNGEFSFPDAEDGSYNISIACPGFASQSKPYVVDATTPPLEIRLERLVTLPLHIVKPDNKVLQGVVVTVRLNLPQAPPIPLVRASTDANGDASLPGLMPGTYTIQVLADGVGVATLRNVEVRYAATPSAIDVRLQAAGTLRIVARESQAGKEPRPVGGATATFTTDSDSDAAKGAGGANYPEDMMIYVMRAAQPGGPALVTHDGDGVLQIADLAPGTYTTRLFSPAHKPMPAQTVEVRAGQTTTAEFLVEALSPLVTFDVLVRDTKDKPVADTEFQIQLRPAGGGNVFGAGAPPPAPDMPPAIRTLFGSGNFSRRARSDKDGKITLYPLPPGKWRVTVITPPGPDGAPGSSFKDVTVTAQGGSVTIPVNMPAPAAKQ